MAGSVAKTKSARRNEEARWQQVLDRDHPVLGLASDHDDVSEDYAQLKRNMEDVVDFVEAEGKLTEADEALSGKSADALKELTDEMLGLLTHLPILAGSVKKVFDDQAASLELLQVRADQALARAEANWSARQNAGSQLDSAIADQLDDLDSLENAKDAAEQKLGESVADWDAIRLDSEEDDRLYGDRLREVDLGPLADPAWYEKIAGALLDFVCELGEFAEHLVEAVLKAVFELAIDLLVLALEVLITALLIVLSPLLILAILVMFVFASPDARTEYLKYLKESSERRANDNANPISRAANYAFEDTVAAIGILGMDGELYKGDDNGYCDGSHACIVGVSAPKSAVTLGHTVLYDSPQPPGDMVTHEQQHVFQYEEHNVGGFLSRWVLSSATDFALGGDGYYDTYHEKEGYYAQEVKEVADPNLQVPEGYSPTDGGRRDYGFRVYEGSPRQRQWSEKINLMIWE